MTQHEHAEHQYPDSAALAPEALLTAMGLLQAGTPLSVDAADVALEGGTDPAFGTVQWRTLFCADRTPTSELVIGVAEFGPQGTLLSHRHAPAEFYFGLSGSGVVTIEGVAHPIKAGVAVYLPGNCEHGVQAGDGGLQFLYGFPRDRFGEVDYRFSEQHDGL